MNRSYALTILLALAACDNGTAAPNIDYSALLGTLTDQVVVPETQTFATDAEALVTSLHALQAATNGTTLANAQSAWRKVRADWRTMDALHFGPLTDEGIDSRIDYAPASPTDIEAAIASSSALDDTFVSDAGGQDKGFLGVEYLIFSASGSDAALAKLTGSDGARRLQLALSMADEINASSQDLLMAWTVAYEGGPSYALQVKTAGAGSPRYALQRTAMEDFDTGVSGALDVVARRLAIPLGETTLDLDGDPTMASGNAVNDMNATLSGITMLWAAPGMSTKVSSASVTTEAMTTQAACVQQVAAIPGPFDTTVIARKSVVQAVYNACDGWKKLWNTDVIVALGGTMPILDTDGD